MQRLHSIRRLRPNRRPELGQNSFDCYRVYITGVFRAQGELNSTFNPLHHSSANMRSARYPEISREPELYHHHFTVCRCQVRIPIISVDLGGYASSIRVGTPTVPPPSGHCLPSWATTDAGTCRVLLLGTFQVAYHLRLWRKQARERVPVLTSVHSSFSYRQQHAGDQCRFCTKRSV